MCLFDRTFTVVQSVISFQKSGYYGTTDLTTWLVLPTHKLNNGSRDYGF